jgi:hypothetical protein
MNPAENPMSTQQSQPANNRSRRIATRDELTRFYAAIGIPAVISAMQANKMQIQAKGEHNGASAHKLPAFLKEIQPVS